MQDQEIENTRAAIAALEGQRPHVVDLVELVDDFLAEATPERKLELIRKEQAEGKLVAIVPPERADLLLAAMRAHPLGGKAALIGEVLEDPHHFVQMRTRFGGKRIVGARVVGFITEEVVAASDAASAGSGEIGGV